MFSKENLIAGLKEGRFERIAIMTGAGISVSAGIPDFRSPKTGLYANLGEYDLPTPESMFNLKFFQRKPEPFYKLASEFLNVDKYRPTVTHHFIKLLHDKGLV